MCQRYHTNKMVELPDRSTGSKSKNIKGSFNYKTKYSASWFSQQNLKQYKDVITQSKLGESYFHCKIFNKDVLCSHGGASDLVRHCTTLSHQKLETTQKTTDILTRKAEIKSTRFLAEHNLPIAAADYLSSLIKECFPDSKIDRSYSCARAKS